MTHKNDNSELDDSLDFIQQKEEEKFEEERKKDNQHEVPKDYTDKDDEN